MNIEYLNGDVSVELYAEAHSLQEAFSTACNGLVELSSMPKYNASKWSSGDEEGTLPPWLQALILCSTLQQVL